MRPNRVRPAPGVRRFARTGRGRVAFGQFALQPGPGAADTSPEPLLHGDSLPEASVCAVTPR